MSSRSRTPALESLAMIKAVSDVRHESYLDILATFAAAAILQAGLQVIANQDVQTAIESEFGLRMPLHAVTALVTRLRKRGQVALDHGILHAEPDRLRDDRFERLRRDVTTSYGTLLSDLRRYASAQHAVEWTEAEAGDALQSQLTRNLMVLAPHQTGPVIAHPDSSSYTRFVVASYITSLHEGDAREALSALDRLAQGYMIANAVYLPNLGSYRQRFKGLPIFLDTPVLIAALGYSGRPRIAPAREMLTLLHSAGASLQCFRHTFQEVRGALEACLHHVQGNNYLVPWGPAAETLENFLESGYSVSDLIELIDSLELSLRRWHVTIPAVEPGFETHAYVIDEVGLSDALKKAIPNYRPEPLERDVKSVAAIMRLRRGRQADRVEDSGGVFITSNPRLVRVTRSFSEKETGPGSVGPCLTDFAVTNLVWLMSPTAKPSVPIGRLVADSYAALHPDEALWSAFGREVEKLRQRDLITDDDCLELRYSLEARAGLFEESQGSAQAVTEGTVLEVVRRVREEHARRAQLTVAEEVSRLATKSAESADEAARLRRQFALQNATIDRRAAVAAKGCAWTLYCAIVVGLGALTWAASPLNGVWWSGKVGGYVTTALLLALDVLGLLGLATGWSARSLVSPVEHTIRTGIEWALHRLVTPGGSP